MKPAPQAVYSLQDCSFAYPGSPCLHDLSIDFTPGQFYGLIGPNGSGKTTLINLLAASRQPTGGVLHFHGRPVATYSKQELARLLALVPQQFAMEFAFTVEEVVLMGRHPHIPRFASPTEKDRQIVTTALQTLDITHLRNRLIPHLSGGERQRVVVARALAQSTAVLLLDEATASLDIRHSIDIMTALKKKVHDDGATVIAAIHDLDMAAAFCDQLVVLLQGQLYASGPVAAVLSAGLLQQVFAVPATIEGLADGRPHVRYSYRPL